MTKQMIKPEDYRELTSYWFNRLCETTRFGEADFEWEGAYYKFKKFDYNIMTLGYPKSTDTERILKLEHKGIEIRTGNHEWGAEPDKLYFVILHGAAYTEIKDRRGKNVGGTFIKE